MKHIKLLKSLIIVAPVLALASPLIILSNTGCGNPELGEPLPDGSNWVGRTGGTLDYESNSEDHTYAITGNDRFTANSNFTIPHYVVIDNEEYVVTIIGNGAFWGCVGLKGVNLGGVTAIGNTAFWGCPLERIGVDQDNSAFELIGTSTNGFIRKTSDGEGDTITPACGTSGGIACGSITFPNDALTISDYAFRECIGITGVDLANVTTIDNNAFYGCIGMTGVDLRGVTTIGDSAFVGCPIEEINVAQNNTVYHLEGTSTNGFILRTGDDDTLTPACGTRGGIACGSITIPEGFDTIDEGTFYACGGLTRVDFDSTTIIGGRAFFGCERISEIDLSNVTDLGMDWCYNCLNLSSVIIGTQTYDSTDDGWDNVGPDTGCILYAPNETVADAFKTYVIDEQYAGKWAYQHIG